MHHLNLVAVSLDTKVPFQNEVAAMLLLFRAISPYWYQRFTLGNVTEDQILNSLVAGMHYEEPNNGLAQTACELVLWSVRFEILEKSVDMPQVLERILRDRRIPEQSQLLRELEQCLDVMAGSHFRYSKMDLKGLLRRIELLSAGHNSELMSN